jgi:L-amino acid N-acyltransferase YncA
MTIRPIIADDYSAVAAIYAQGIATQNATFEQAPPDWETWSARHLSVSRLVAVEGDQIMGFVALMPYSSRTVYAGVAVLSIYIHQQFRGLGLGKILLEKLIETSEASGIWMLQAGILPENVASIALHEKLGFRQVGYRERIAKMNGKWRDILLMERRSLNIGDSDDDSESVGESVIEIFG